MWMKFGLLPPIIFPLQGCSNDDENDSFKSLLIVMFIYTILVIIATLKLAQLFNPKKKTTIDEIKKAVEKELKSLKKEGAIKTIEDVDEKRVREFLSNLLNATLEEMCRKSEIPIKRRETKAELINKIISKIKA